MQVTQAAARVQLAVKHGVGGPAGGGGFAVSEQHRSSQQREMKTADQSFEGLLSMPEQKKGEFCLILMKLKNTKPRVSLAGRSLSVADMT